MVGMSLLGISGSGDFKSDGVTEETVVTWSGVRFLDNDTPNGSVWPREGIGLKMRASAFSLDRRPLVCTKALDRMW